MSKIEWTDRTWNPVRGCTRVSPGCGGPGDHGGCYAEGMAARFSKPGMWGHGFAEMQNGKPRWTGKVELQEDRLAVPLHWSKPCKVFVNSTSDLFHEALPDTAIDRVFAVMAIGFHHDYQVLTKRSERAQRYISDVYTSERVWRLVLPLLPQYPDLCCDWMGTNRALAENYTKNIERSLRRERPLPDLGRRLLPWPLPNVWMGTSCEDQARADERIPHLLATPAAVRFVSAEPLLGPIDLALGKWVGLFSGRFDEPPTPKLDWIIVGGEFGLKARPMHPDWARSIRDQCQAAGVAFFFKQHGEWLIGEPQAEPKEWLYKFQDGTDFADVSEGSDIMLDTAYSHHGNPERLWRNYWATGEGHLGKRVGKSAAGRLLDGRTWDQFPEVRT